MNTTNRRGRRIGAGALSLLALAGLAVGVPTADAAAVTRADLYYGLRTLATAQAATLATREQETGVVLINTVTPQGSGAGTGMVLRPDGVVLTNYHVVEGSTHVRVTVATTGQTYDARVLGHDATKDVAVVQLQGASGLATVRLDTDGVRAGEQVTAVGNAQGRQVLVQASGRVTDPTSQVTAGDDASGAGSETLTDVFQSTVVAEPGDSGGPMFDAQGEVVGMTTAGTSDHGTSGRFRAAARTAAAESYAVRIADAIAVVQEVEAGHEQGSVVVGPNPYLGVQLTGGEDGLTLVGTSAGTPAAAAGLQAGQTITSVDGTQVTNRADLSKALTGLQPGQTVTLRLTDTQGGSTTALLTLATSPLN